MLRFKIGGNFKFMILLWVVLKWIIYSKKLFIEEVILNMLVLYSNGKILDI